MVKRKIIKIDEELCTGCGECIPNCPEGAIQLIDGKARMISDIFCDGLGACMGHCPVDAITIEEREAEKYDEKKVMVNVVKQGENVIKAHLKHLRDHNQHEYLDQAVEYLKENKINIPLDKESPIHEEVEPLACGCPGSAVQVLSGEQDIHGCEIKTAEYKVPSQLNHWPVQLMLVPPTASYLKNANLLITADCVPVANPNFHNELLKGKIVLMGCPKFDKMDYFLKKLVDIFKTNNPKSITIAMMEVPCCFGLNKLVLDAVNESGMEIPVETIVINVKGEKIQD
jgi:NAD-dependent dihydropyrimidine dehydrogenase PreA subunit